MEGSLVDLNIIKKALSLIDEKIFIIDDDYNLVYKNWESDENFYGIKCWKFLHSKDDICNDCNVAKVLNTGIRDSQLFQTNSNELYKMESSPIYVDGTIKYVVVHLKELDEDFKEKLLSNDNIEFERLINKVYNSFVDSSENPFKTSVEIIGKRLNITSIAVHKINPYNGSLKNIAKWKNDGIYSDFEVNFNFNSLHWLNSVMNNTELLSIKNLNDLPSIATAERVALLNLNYNAAILYPIKLENKLAGILFIGSKEAREWTHFEISFIKQYGRILKTAFIQREKHFKTESSRKRLEMAQTISNSGSFQWYFETRKLHISKNLKSIWGFNPLKNDYKISDFVKRIHPDDINFVKKEFKKSLRHRFPLNINFRIIIEGTVKHFNLVIKYIFNYSEVESLIGVVKDISAEEVNTKNVNYLLENSFYPNFTINDKFEITSINKGFEQLLGFDKEELIGKNIYEIIDDNSQLKLKTSRLMEIEDNQIRNLEINFTGKNNRIINTQLNGLVIKGRNKYQKQINFTVHDITSIIRALESLQASERRFRSTLESMQLFAVLLNQEGNIIFCNKYLLKKTGYSFSELLNKNWFDTIVDEEDVNKAKKIFDLSIVDESVLNNLTYKIRTKQGKALTIEWNNSVSRSRDLTVFSSIGKDITELLKQQKEIKKLSESVEQSPDAVVIISADCNIEYVNKSFTILTDFKKTDVLGKNIHDLKIWENFDILYTEICQKVNKKEIWKSEIRALKKDGSKFWINISISPILSNKNIITNFVCIFEDITEDKRLKEELIEAKEKAEQANKLKTEFLASMSHEIRTPVHSILCLNSIIEEEFYNKAQDEIKEAFRLMKEAGNRIIRTIDLILNLSDLQAGTYNYMPNKIDLVSRIINPLVRQYRYISESKNLKLLLQNSSSNPCLFIDEYSVTQIFDNLLNNAIKYTNKGKIEVIIEEKENLIVRIKDTGIGISEDYLPNIFNIFSQENHGYKRIYEGNGIGLALVKKYADLNNIKIDVKSKKNEGTEFILTFKK